MSGLSAKFPNLKTSTLALAFLIGLFFSSQHIFGYFLAGAEYQAFDIKADYDEYALYGPRALRIFDSELSGDINLFEHQGEPSFLPLANPVILGSAVRILGSIDLAVTFYSFILPAFIFLICFLIAQEIGLGETLSMLFSFLFVTGNKVASHIPAFFFNRIFFSPDFGRFEYPQITFLFYALAFYYCLRAIKEENKKLKYVAGIFTGSLFYTYLYDWVSFIGGLFIALMLLVLLKKQQSARILLKIVAVAFIVSIPYWMNYFMLHALPQFNDITGRIGIEISNQFRGSTWTTYLRVSLLSILLYFTARKQEQIHSLISGMLLSVFLTLNLQVILGFNPQPDHWFRTLFFVADISLFIVLSNLFSLFYKKYPSLLYPKTAYFLTIAAPVILILLLLPSQYKTAKDRAAYLAAERPANAAFAWLRSNTNKNEVVASLQINTNYDLQVHTKNKLFLPYGLSTTASNDEIWDRYIQLNKFFFVSSANFINSFHENGAPLYLFHNYYRSNKHDSYFSASGRSLPEKKQIDILKEFENTIQKPFNLEHIRYRIDLVLLTPSEQNIKSEFEKRDTFQKVYDNKSYTIFKIKHL